MESATVNSVPASTGQFDSPQLEPDVEFGTNLAERAAGARERAEILEYQAAQQRRIQVAAEAGLNQLNSDEQLQKVPATRPG